MIHYQLRCSGDHAFDGWFRDSAAFDQQAGAGLLSCPACGVTDVKRALMAPALGRSRTAPAQLEARVETGVEAPVEAGPETAARPLAPQPAMGGALPDGMRSMLQRMRAEVEKRCDYVGNAFAAEARRIHNGRSGVRGIYGETTPEEAERLADDGIEVSRMPWVPRADG